MNAEHLEIADLPEADLLDYRSTLPQDQQRNSSGLEANSRAESATSVAPSTVDVSALESPRRPINNHVARLRAFFLGDSQQMLR